MTERRFTEMEVAAIFQRAAETPPPGASAASAAADDGLTLADLQAIGREVGIPAESVASAARVVVRDADAPSRTRTVLGLPLGVACTVELGRRLTDDEWERLVVDLRETFDARGRLTSQGSLREWTNGNLQALLEPGEGGGHRLRLRTTKGNAASSLLLGSGLMVMSVAMLAAAHGALVADAAATTTVAALGLAGVTVLGSNALRLPRWARTRRQQMEALAARAVARVTAHVAVAPPTSGDARLTAGDDARPRPIG